MEAFMIKRCMGCKEIRECHHYEIDGINVCTCSKKCAEKRVKVIKKIRRGEYGTN